MVKILLIFLESNFLGIHRLTAANINGRLYILMRCEDIYEHIRHSGNIPGHLGYVQDQF